MGISETFSPEAVVAFEQRKESFEQLVRASSERVKLKIAEWQATLERYAPELLQLQEAGVEHKHAGSGPLLIRLSEVLLRQHDRILNRPSTTEAEFLAQQQQYEALSALVDRLEEFSVADADISIPRDQETLLKIEHLFPHTWWQRVRSALKGHLKQAQVLLSPREPDKEKTRFKSLYFLRVQTQLGEVLDIKGGGEFFAVALGLFYSQVEGPHPGKVLTGEPLTSAQLQALQAYQIDALIANGFLERHSPWLDHFHQALQQPSEFNQQDGWELSLPSSSGDQSYIYYGSPISASLFRYLVLTESLQRQSAAQQSISSADLKRLSVERVRYLQQLQRLNLPTTTPEWLATEFLQDPNLASPNKYRDRIQLIVDIMQYCFQYDSV